jgi:hypothetical protein
MTGETLLEVRGISAGYNGAAVLRRVNLEVRSGEAGATTGVKQSREDHHASRNLRTASPHRGKRLLHRA